MPPDYNKEKRVRIYRKAIIISSITMIICFIIVLLLNVFIFQFSLTDSIIGNVMGISIGFILVMWIVIRDEWKEKEEAES